LAGTIVVDRIESDASYASNINVASQITFSNTSTFSGNLLVGTTTAQTGAKLVVTGGIQGTITSGTSVASTSGTSIDFTSLPSWVKRITVMFNGVSTSGTSQKILQLGTGSTTFTTTGYVTSSSYIVTSVGTLAYTNGFNIYNLVLAADTLSGIVVFTNITGNTWVGSGSVSQTTGTAVIVLTAGSIALSAALTAVRITTAGGTDTFDAGSINILYEG